MTLDLTLFGGFAARVGPISIALPTRKAQALLAYLALAPDRAHEREKLCALLWGDTGREQAHNSLRQTLFSARKALPAEARAALVASGRTVALDPAQVTVDALLLERHAASAARDELEEAAALYRGPLLEGFSLEESGFEEWLTLERARFSALACAALGRLADAQADAGALDSAVQTHLQLLRLEPWAEHSHRQLMILHLRQGRRVAALAQYQQCVATLSRELGVEPELATRRLYEDVEARASVRERNDVEARASVRERKDTVRFEPSRAGDVPRSDDTVRDRGGEPVQRHRPGGCELVGRERELTRLRVELEAGWLGGGRVTVLVGEAGVGKSRLLEELAAEAQARGGLVLQGRCFESEQVLPFAPWVDAFRRELAQLDEAFWEAFSPSVRSALARLWPRGETPPHDVPSRENALRLFEAVLALLGRIGERAPLLLLLDDLHWADDMSLRLLSFLGRRLAASPRICLAASVRKEELARASFLITALGELAREDCSFTMPIAPLSSHETHALVTALTSSRAPSADPRTHEQIWALSEGNPFVVVEAVRALCGGVLRPDVAGLPIPERVREVIAGHVARLSSFEQQLVAIAAVIGRAFDFSFLRAACDGDASSTAAAVEELVRGGLFEARGETFYFSHERIREVVYDGLLPPRRALLHGRVARALAALHADALAENAGRLAFHYGRADEPAAAVTYLTRFADHAALSFGLQEALSALAEARAFIERLAPTLRPRWRLEVAVREANCLFFLGRFAEIVPCLTQHLPILDELKLPELTAQVHFWLGCANDLLGNARAAASNAERALAEAMRCDGTRTARRAHTLLAWEAAFSGRYQKGIEHGLAATVSLAAADAEPEYQSAGWLTAGVNYLYAGRPREALDALGRASSIAQVAGIPRVEGLALGMSGLAWSELEELTEALAACERAVEIAPDPVSKSGTLNMLGHVQVRAGRLDDALAVLHKLIDDSERAGTPAPGSALSATAEAYLQRGDARAARLWAERGLAAAREAHHPLTCGAALRVLGQSARALGDAAAARALLEESRQQLSAIGAASQLGRTLHALGLFAQETGELELAADVLREAERLYRSASLDLAADRIATLLVQAEQPDRAACAS